jgi:hypothetical protein
MKVFISYANEDRDTAELIASALVVRGLSPFIDRRSLPPGRAYDERIQKQVSESDVFLYLVSPDSIENGSYTLTELGYAEHRWPNPDRYVLPIMVRPTPIEHLPTYLRSITILKPIGNIPAEVGSAIDRMLDLKTKWVAAKTFAICGAVSGLIGAFFAYDRGSSLFGFKVFGIAPDIGIAFAIFVCIAIFITRKEIQPSKIFLCGAIIVAAFIASPQVLRLSNSGISIYPDHIMANLPEMVNYGLDTYHAYAGEAIAELIKKYRSSIDKPGAFEELENLYVPVPQAVIFRLAGVSSLFMLLTWFGFSAVLKRTLSWPFVPIIVISGFIFGATSAACLGFSSISIFILRDSMFPKYQDALWSYPDLIISTMILQLEIAVCIGVWLVWNPGTAYSIFRKVHTPGRVSKMSR